MAARAGPLNRGGGPVVVVAVVAAGGGVVVLVVLDVVVFVVVIHEKGGDVLDCGGEHCGVEGDGGKELSREYKMQP